MKRLTVLLIFCCVLAGGALAEQAEQSHEGRGIPVKIGVQEGRPLPVGIETQGGKRLPVELDEPLEVEIKAQTNEVLPVKLVMQDGEAMLVEAKIPPHVLKLLAALVSGVFLMVVVGCFSAVAACRSARAAYKLAESIKQIQQQD